jgi:tRNA(Ile)-lysidine synthase
MGPHPAVAQVRGCVRQGLAGLEPGDLVLAACSGGADSLALAAALAHEAPRLGLRGGGVTVDHGLQDGSAERAGRVAAVLRQLGLDPVHQVSVTVATGPGSGGPEGAARTARYAALEQAAEQAGAAAVLLGHTRDDQAETVLLGLARGSGARSLAGMPGASGRYLRPLLGLRRGQTGAACSALGLEPWDDPQNADPAFARTRVRQQVLPVMEELLGPGITEALARTADRLRADADALDALTDEAARRLMPGWGGTAADGAGAGRADGRMADLALDVAALAALPAAIRTRLLRRAAIAAGAPAGSLSSMHVTQLDALVTSWRGQRWSDLPGGIRCQRRYGKLHFTTGQ